MLRSSLIAVAASLGPHLNAGQNIPSPLITFDTTWTGERFSFVGNFQPFLDPPEAEDSFLNPAHDDDNDGIWTKDNIFLPGGVYDVAVFNLDTSQVYGLHGSQGSLGDDNIIKRTFTVEDGGSPVHFFFDWRDKVFEVSTTLMPIVCGDFMADAGYYSTSVGVADANWNPDNMLGWLKEDADGNGVSYTTYLHLPPGVWQYKICFQGQSLETSLGFAGSQFPFLLHIASPAGADVAFLYDPASGLVSDSVNLAVPLLLPSPMLSAPLGDRAVSPYLPSELSSWQGHPMSFLGDFGPSADPPQGAWDLVPYIVADEDSDGIAELHVSLLPGVYMFLAIDIGTSTLYDRLGVASPFDLATFKVASFIVPEPVSEGGGGEVYTDVSLFFDWRDKIVGASTGVMPVVCGDFMEAAGYFGETVGAEGANWNPDNLLGWMKNYDDDSDVYRLFLHLPQGSWEYKICFQGQSLETSLGFAGTQFPFLLHITSPAGADVVFLYDPARNGMVYDSVNLAVPLLLPSPMLSAPLGDRAVSPYLPSELSSWQGRPMSFLGDFGPSADPPQGAWDLVPYIVADEDSDGIAELHVSLLPGVYMFLAIDIGTSTLYDRLGVASPFDLATFKVASFIVPEPVSEGGGGEVYTDVSLFFDWRDKIVGASTGVMPVVCGDFMEAAGYFGETVGAEGANWNPDNLLGWQKKYDDSDDSEVYQIFLHVPQGSWSYKIGFYGSSLASQSVGFAGSVFPVLLNVAPASGADVTFLYDHATGTIQDSVNGKLSGFSPATLTTPSALGDHVVSPYLSSDAPAWSGAAVAFLGDYGPSRVTPQASYDPASSTAVDDDGDGIIELGLSLTPGSYQFVVEDQTDLQVYDILGAVVGTGAGDGAGGGGVVYEEVEHPRVFEVVAEPGAERADVSLYVDLRDFGYEASTNPMPVVCGDFMEAAGYFGETVGAEGANWNPDNLMGWMKNYDGGGGLHQIYLRVPEGQWHYMICFRGRIMGDQSIGFGGEASSSSTETTAIPIPLLVPPGGMDISFVYDSTGKVLGDSLNGLPTPPLPSCPRDCGVHGVCAGEVCKCEVGYVGGGCEFETHFSEVFMMEVSQTLYGTPVYTDGPPVEVPVSGGVTCEDLIMNADGSTECISGYQPLNDATVTTTVGGTILTELVDGVEVPVYADGPPEVVQVLVEDPSRNCDNIEECEFHCEEGWTGKFCTLRDHCTDRGGEEAGGACEEGGCEVGWGGEDCLQRAPLAGGGGLRAGPGGTHSPVGVATGGGPE